MKMEFTDIMSIRTAPTAPIAEIIPGLEIVK